MLPFLSLSLHLVDICVSKRKLTLRTTGTEHYCHAYRSTLRMRFRNFNCTSLAARKTRVLSNHPTVLSLQHPLVDGLTAREAQLVEDGMISPKFFGSMPTFWLGMQVCRDLLEVNLWRKTHNFPVLNATSFRGSQGLRYLKS